MSKRHFDIFFISLKPIPAPLKPLAADMISRLRLFQIIDRENTKTNRDIVFQHHFQNSFLRHFANKIKMRSLAANDTTDRN